MNEFQAFIDATNGTRKHKTSILKYPTGKYGFVGEIPESLGTWKENSIGQAIFCSNIYKTREEAELALSIVNQ